MSNTSGLALVVSVLFLLWSASNYVAAFGRSVDVLSGYEDPGDKPAILRRLRMFAVTIVFLVLILAAALLFVLTSDAALWTIGTLDIDAPEIISGLALLRWPLAFAIMMGAVALLYFTTPARLRLKGIHKRRKEDRGTFFPGAAIAVVAIGIITLSLTFYLGNFGNYEVVYGALASIIILLLWFWLINVALLYGYVINQELDRRETSDETLDLTPGND